MIDSTETQLYQSKISVLTIPRENFWIFQAGILEIIFRLVDLYETRTTSRYSDNDNASLSSKSDNSLHEEEEEEEGGEDEGENIIEDDGFFFHLAFTTEEVTLICCTHLIKKHLMKAIKLDDQSTLISDEFFLIQVSSDGLNIGKKILELTEPLSLNNISLFFISNYFSDLVLVPIKDKVKTLEILKKNESEQDGELEGKTFQLFKDNAIEPKFVTDVKLIMTGARSGDFITVLKQTAESISRLNVDIGKIGGKRSFPEYFAITRLPTEEIGLLLPFESSELEKLKFSKSNMMGSLQDYYFPIFVDLKKLPLDLKGIVAGMASKLLRMGVAEMSYLSLGRSGVVLIPDTFRETVAVGL